MGINAEMGIMEKMGINAVHRLSCSELARIHYFLQISTKLRTPIDSERTVSVD